MTVTAGVTTLCYGAAGRFLGALATVLGDWAAAEEHFEQALAMNEAMAAPVWLAHNRPMPPCCTAGVGRAYLRSSGQRNGWLLNCKSPHW